MFESEVERAEVMEITPEIAAAMLATSPGNRNLREGYVRTLAAAMVRGEWRVTSQGVAIDRLGRLRDAHHRLTAVVRAGVSIRTVVVYGLRPDSYEVTDTGINRTCADLLSLPKDQASVLRFGATTYLGAPRPTADQLHAVASSGLLDVADRLIDYCGIRARYYSAAPMRLAACILIMEADKNADYVLEQYRALCQLDFGAMSPAAHSLVRSAAQGRDLAGTTAGRDALARGLKVFDPAMSELSRITVTPEITSSALQRVRSVIGARIEQGGQK